MTALAGWAGTHAASVVKPLPRQTVGGGGTARRVGSWDRAVPAAGAQPGVAVQDLAPSVWTLRCAWHTPLVLVWA